MTLRVPFLKQQKCFLNKRLVNQYLLKIQAVLVKGRIIEDVRKVFLRSKQNTIWVVTKKLPKGNVTLLFSSSNELLYLPS